MKKKNHTIHSKRATAGHRVITNVTNTPLTSAVQQTAVIVFADVVPDNPAFCRVALFANDVRPRGNDRTF